MMRRAQQRTRWAAEDLERSVLRRAVEEQLAVPNRYLAIIRPFVADKPDYMRMRTREFLVPTRLVEAVEAGHYDFAMMAIEEKYKVKISVQMPVVRSPDIIRWIVIEAVPWWAWLPPRLCWRLRRAWKNGLGLHKRA